MLPCGCTNLLHERKRVDELRYTMVVWVRIDGYMKSSVSLRHKHEVAFDKWVRWKFGVRTCRELANVEVQPSTHEGILAALLISISSAQALEYEPAAPCDSHSQAYKPLLDG